MIELEQIGFLYRLALPHLKSLGVYGYDLMPWAIGIGTAYLILTRVYWKAMYGFEATKRCKLAWPVTVPFDLAMMILSVPFGFRISPSRLRVAERQIEWLQTRRQSIDETVAEALSNLAVEVNQLKEQEVRDSRVGSLNRKINELKSRVEEIEQADTVLLR